MPPAAKRQKLANDELVDVSDEPMVDAEDNASSQAPSASGSGSDADDSDHSPDTDDEIAALKTTKSKQTAKRKRRAVSPSRFATQLQTLLGTQVPTEEPLALKPDIAARRAEGRKKLRDRRDADVKRKEKEDKNRLTDVIGGWGGESERALRKIAQRGGA